MVKIETRSRIPIWQTFGQFNGMSSQSHVLYCRVLPLGEITVMIPELHATLQGVRIPSAILKIVFPPYFIFFGFFNAVRALRSGGFRIVSDTLVLLMLRLKGQLVTQILYAMIPYIHLSVCLSVCVSARCLFVRLSTQSRSGSN